MEIDPENIRAKNFSKDRNGFSKTEVLKYLDELADQFNLKLSKISELEQRIDDLSLSLQEYKNIEKELRDSLLFFTESEKSKLLRIKDEADAIINDAEDRSEKIIADAEVEAQSTRDTLLFLKEQKEIFTTRLKIIIDNQEGMLSDLRVNNSAELQKSMAEAAAFRANTEINIEKILEKLL